MSDISENKTKKTTHSRTLSMTFSCKKVKLKIIALS